MPKAVPVTDSGADKLADFDLIATAPVTGSELQQVVETNPLTASR